MTPVLWGRASSVNVQKVMWALAECGIGHARKDAGGKYGQTDTPEFSAMAPMRRVPVWQEGDFTLWESHAILRHLGRGPAAALWPKDAAARATADQWMEFTTSTLLPPFIGVFFQTVRLPQAERSADVLNKHLKALDTALDIVEGQLQRTDWLAGHEFSLADITAGAPMYRYHNMDIPRAARPDLHAWYDRLTSRPAYRETVMTSYDELRAP
ncbi:MAG: glutathione S-transferase family protein [Alphaproteobacteria bacterium]|nr:glutathione S-transferase family protein [Alphaproteobacteria bacterium]